MSVMDRIGNEAGRLGDRFSLDFLRYNSVVIRRFDSMAKADAPSVIGAIRAQFPEARRAIDVGAGSCAYAAEGLRQGLEVTALERSAYGRRLGKRYGVDTAAFDLTSSPPAEVSGPFDLAYCFEVAEHLPAALADHLVRFLCSLAPVIVFTAAVPGQGGTGHINERPQQYWTKRFELNRYEAVPFPLSTYGLNRHWAHTTKLVLRERA